MILYRVMLKREIESLEEQNNSIIFSRKGGNTFSYEPNTEYMHFFKYAEHARYYLRLFGVVIAQIDVPDELIEQSGFGFYIYQDKNIKGIMPIPEYIIKKDNFKIQFIKDCQEQIPMDWTLLNGDNIEEKYQNVPYAKLYSYLLLDLQKKYKEENNLEISFNEYAVNQLMGNDLDTLLLTYLDFVENEKEDTKDYEKKKTLNIFKKHKKTNS